MVRVSICFRSQVSFQSSLCRECGGKHGRTWSDWTANQSAPCDQAPMGQPMKPHGCYGYYSHGDSTTDQSASRTRPSRAHAAHYAHTNPQKPTFDKVIKKIIFYLKNHCRQKNMIFFSSGKKLKRFVFEFKIARDKS